MPLALTSPTPPAAAVVTPERAAWFIAIFFGITPLWAGQNLPMVDLPQHLHLISVLHRLSDTSTLYPQIFAARPVLTPYLGYYYLVSGLSWLLPLDLANRVFLTAYVAGLPLSLGFLLSSLKRPTWPALLALPFAYGDSFAWGFVNYISALPLAFLVCGFFVRTIEDAARRRVWALALGATLVAVLLFHVQVFAWLGVALPFLLLTTPAPEGKTWRARLPAVYGVVPGVLLFVLWVGLRVGQPQEIAPGQPWKSWGPMLSEQNLSYKTPAQNFADLVAVPRDQTGALDWSHTRFPILAGMLPDGGDDLAVELALFAAVAAVALSLWKGRATVEGPVARWRVLGLAALAALLLFTLPFDIRGYMYYLNTRYAHLLAALLVVCVPPLKPEWAKRAVWAGAALAVVMALPLYRAFKAFDGEAQAVRSLAEAAPERARVFGMVVNSGSMARSVTHPMFLHSSCLIARERGGLTNFSFALTPHSPLMYRGEPPPNPPSEWRPQEMRWEQHGQFYDTFVVRGVRPEQVFGSKMGGELQTVAEHDGAFLVRKR